MFRIGIDIVEVDRIREITRKWGNRFLDRSFTQSELDYSFRHRNPWPHLAARFAAKEALVKITGRKFSFHEIGIDHDENERPFFRFSERTEATKKCFSDLNVRVSLSHTNALAVAVVVGSEMIEKNRGL